VYCFALVLYKNAQKLTTKFKVSETGKNLFLAHWFKTRFILPLTDSQWLLFLYIWWAQFAQSEKWGGGSFNKVVDQNFPPIIDWANYTLNVTSPIFTSPYFSICTFNKNPPPYFFTSTLCFTRQTTPLTNLLSSAERSPK